MTVVEIQHCVGFLPPLDDNPPLLMTERVYVEECDCCVALGIRLDKGEPALAVVPCENPEHAAQDDPDAPMNQVVARIYDSLSAGAPQDISMSWIVREIMQSAFTDF